VDGELASDAAGDGDIAALVELVKELLDLTVVLFQSRERVGHWCPLLVCDV
jgi:hypothetical protein